MAQPAIRVEGLSKSYRIGAAADGMFRYKTFRDAIAAAAAAPMRRFRKPMGAEASRPTVWALKDVSFEVPPGEVLGIIGHNGAGKSTLLKILSRITQPTSGRAHLHGRVGSLLEVGTGFHAELTGRENIYLCGGILGMSKREIRRRFDDIVSFAQTERFVDTPVKRYSTGMYLRLGFAVAVHLDPEILIIDEVLSVGDAQFQRKCFDKLQQVSRASRTILFVSHNMYAVRSICSRAMVLHGGRLVADGEVSTVIDQYAANTHPGRVPGVGTETESFRVDRVSISCPRGPVVKTSEPLDLRVTLTAKQQILDPGLYIGILTQEGQRLTGLDLRDFRTGPVMQPGDAITLGFSLDSCPLLPGIYQLELHVKDMAQHRVEFVPGLFEFEVVETPVYGGRKLDTWYGHVALSARAIVDPASEQDWLDADHRSPAFSR